MNLVYHLGFIVAEDINDGCEYKVKILWRNDNQTDIDNTSTRRGLQVFQKEDVNRFHLVGSARK